MELDASTSRLSSVVRLDPQTQIASFSAIWTSDKPSSNFIWKHEIRDSTLTASVQRVQKRYPMQKCFGFAICVKKRWMIVRRLDQLESQIDARVPSLVEAGGQAVCRVARGIFVFQ